ncbi:SET family sugar efflux transporter-like MFS transporter [Motilibacter peucedani]|uniref:SET family sugar efflux transporter-like MFS transporter n=1 Tax=Motilibacter peucedani TaxID=598650 RepID=A0A420XM72_9ACTN|nr:MFS transporter [Motilibacter peucedani]RKS71503.1 SET family sugar efflux transporter-like MFS transporter [Motilibacter peucedani]
MPADPAGRRALVCLAAAVFLLGTADAMTGAYLVLFGFDEVGLSPVAIGVLSSTGALASIVASSRAGRGFDRRPSRAYALGAVAAGAVGYAAVSVTRSYAVLLLLVLLPLGALGAAFPQLFALARLVLGDGEAGQRSAPLLRSVWSLAWALGPLLGALVLHASGYTALFAVAAAVLALTAVVVLGVPEPASAAPPSPEGDGAEGAVLVAGARVAVLASSVTLFFTAMFAGSVALPIYVTHGGAHGADFVGLLFSACAAVEVVAALALAAAPARVSQRALITGSTVAFAAYFAVTASTHDATVLLLAQVLRGTGIAVVGAAGIRFFQDLLAPATARATTLFSNATIAGSLVSGVLAGGSVSAVGARPTLALCGLLALVSATVFALASRPARRAAPRPA